MLLALRSVYVFCCFWQRHFCRMSSLNLLLGSSGGRMFHFRCHVGSFAQRIVELRVSVRRITSNFCFLSFVFSPLLSIADELYQFICLLLARTSRQAVTPKRFINRWQELKTPPRVQQKKMSKVNAHTKEGYSSNAWRECCVVLAVFNYWTLQKNASRVSCAIDTLLLADLSSSLP